MIDFSNKDKVAIITKELQYTYSDFNNNVNKYALLFSEKKAVRVAILSENRPEWMFAFYAGWKNNATIVPIDYMSSNSDVSFILKDCKPEIIFVSNQKKDDLDNILKEIEYNPDIINIDNIESVNENVAEEWKDPSDDKKTALIIYTSGTTGSPKGVMLSFTNLLANVNEVCNEVKIFDKEQQVLMLLPLHHIFPLLGTMIAPFYIGGTVVMSPSMQSSDLLDTLKNNKVGLMVGVPRLYELIYKGLKAKVTASFAGRLFLSVLTKVPSKKLAKKIFKKVHEGFGGHLEYMIAGGAALSPEVGGFFKTLGFSILEGYGMSEAAPMITFNRPDNFRIGTPGQKLKTVDIEIRDGEIVAKGPNIMQGYFNRPKETADILKDGWLYTGDLGYIDKKGFLYITGRKKEIIVLSNGKNINPVEIEEKLVRMSNLISEVAIHINNDSLHALIVPDYKELSKEEIKNLDEYFKNGVISEYNKHSSSYKRIMQLTIMSTEIPRTRLGKIQRFKLSELLESNQQKKDNVKEPSSKEYQSIKTFIEGQTNNDVYPDDHLEFDIALDSLGKLSLIDFIDKSFGIKITETELISFASVKKIAEFIEENKQHYKIENIDWADIIKEKVDLKLPRASFTFHIFKYISKIFFKLFFRFKSCNVKNIPLEPCIIAPNHQSFFDALFVATPLKNEVLDNTYFYAKAKHVNNMFLKLLANNNNIIVVDLNNNLKESIQKLAVVLSMGKNIIIFPEGTRTKTGQLNDFKKMFAILSKEMNVPIVPVAINGAFKAFGNRKIPKLFTSIEVDFLKPIYPQSDDDYDALTDKTKKEIQAKINPKNSGLDYKKSYSH
jgi:long-chain acyl-CoA synthetase